MKILKAICILGIVIACDKKDPEAILFKTSGLIQKGPFIQGSEVNLISLDNALNPTGTIFTSETTDDFGSFTYEKVSAGYAKILATGFYFNEITGKLSNANITLKALSLISREEKVNINLLTTLSSDRIEYLIVNEKKSFQEAQTISQKEVLKIFKISDDVALNPFEELDLSKDETGSSILLAISCILQIGNSEAQLSELIKKIAEDIKIDGDLNNNSIKEILTKSAMDLEADKIILNLQKRYSDLGLSVRIPDFTSYIDSDGDGTIDLNQARAPYFNLPGGEYPNDIKVEISSTTQNAIIYYTIDNSIPTTSSLVYSNPIEINGDGNSVTIKAITIKEGLNISPVLSAVFSINYPILPALDLNPPPPPLCCNPGEAFTTDMQISIASVIPGVSIYYTTDNSIPTNSSNLYTTPINLVGDGARLTLKAIAMKVGYKSSSVAVGSYGIEYPKALYSISKPSGVYNTNTTVAMNTLDGLKIYYTLDSSEPTQNSILYTQPINFEGDGSIVILKGLVTGPQFKPTTFKSAYKIDYNYDPTVYLDELNLTDYKSMIVGRWIGSMNTPWPDGSSSMFQHSPYSVEVIFSSDGKITTVETRNLVWYWGPNTDFSSYSLDSVLENGKVIGTVGGTNNNIITMKNVAFSQSGDYLTFETYKDAMGPITYRLMRLPD